MFHDTIWRRRVSRLPFLLTVLTASSAASIACASTAAGPLPCLLVEANHASTDEHTPGVEVVQSGLTVPWAIDFLPNGDMLVTERPGRIRLIKDGVLQPESVAEIAVRSVSEDGALGIAVHPEVSTNGWIYLYYTLEEGGKIFNRVQRFVLQADFTKAVADKVIVDHIPGEQYHDGGRLRFGPDGLLYIGTGDARNPPLSQDPTSLAGKILRVTDEGAIPSDNPWPGQAAFIIGIRNTQGFDWIDTDTLIVTDHGPSGDLNRYNHDEVSIARKGDNLGWPTIYGCARQDGLVSPLISWSKATPPGGAALYRGPGPWRNSLLIGVLGDEHLQRVQFNADFSKVLSNVQYIQGNHGRLREVIQTPDGDLLVTTSNCDGRNNCPADKDKILRITPPESGGRE